VLIALSVVGDPAVSAATFVGLSVLAVRAGLLRLVVVSLVVGLALLVAVPGVALVDGSWQFAYADGAWSLPAGAGGWLAVAGGAVRVPCLVLATAFLALVPGRLAIAASARMSPSTALLGGLVARLRPLLLRDLRLTREELASRGLRVDRRAPFVARCRGAVVLWEATVSGLLDRAFGTAAALETRGYGHASPTAGALADPLLDDGVRVTPGRDRLLLGCAAALLVSSVVGRANGVLAPPPIQVFVGSPVPFTAVSALTAGLGLALGLIGARSSAVRSAPAPPATAARTAIVPMRGEARALDVCGATMRYPASAAPALAG